jgi:ParB family chromosome partitioning protein
VPDTWFVSDGNRCLAALRMVYGEDSSQLVDVKPRPAEDAFEDSLAVAVLAHKLHPIDEFEGFTKLLDRGKTHEEIARQYGLTEKEVLQALALGGQLSPTVRDLWRNGEIRAEVAKALTLAPDHATQDAILEKLRKELADEDRPLSELDGDEIKEELKLGAEGAGALVEFVGIDAYVKRGGKVTRDLFGTDHKVSDAKLAKAMAAEKLTAECKALTAAGWSFAVTKDSVRNKTHDYSSLKVDIVTDPEEQKRLDDLRAIFDPSGDFGTWNGPSFGDLSAAQQTAFLEHRELERVVKLRAYPPKLMAKSGCFVGIDDNGLLSIEYGRVKPAQKEAAAKEVKDIRREQAKAVTEAVAGGKPAPESTVLSNALKQRLESQLIAATRDAIMGDPLLGSSPFADVLARTICAQIIPDRPFSMPDTVRTKLPSIRQALTVDVFTNAIIERFDGKDYFGSAPKGIVLKAISEAINPDEARKVAKKSKAEIGKFAIANVTKTGWLPKELRTMHYRGPGSESYEKPAGVAIVVEDSTPAPAAKPVAKPRAAAGGAHGAKTDRKKGPPRKAAAPKKAAKKTAAKKRKAS